MGKVIKKIIYKIKVECVSPISVSGGDNSSTDSDVLRDYDGNPFVAGSTLAGAFRDCLGLRRDKDGLMGCAGKDNSSGSMSKLYISDLTFDNVPKVVTRDGVGLDENKTTLKGAKFDMETVDSGSSGSFWIEATVREGDDETLLRDQISTVIDGIAIGDIRLGSKKTRGFGSMKILGVGIKEFDGTNILDYKTAYSSDVELCAWETNRESSDKYVHIKIPLRLTGGISIRQYQAKKGEPDYKHITANGKPVIPGTSFAGAIRRRCIAIAKEVLGDDSKIKDLTQDCFGYVGTSSGNKETARISRVIFGESIIEGAKPLNISRTAVSRFESSAKDGALYTETTYIGGDLVLEIKVDKRIKDKAIPYMVPALFDLQRGYLPVGGLTSIGRGILADNGPILIDGEPVAEDALNNYASILEEVN